MHPQWMHLGPLPCLPTFMCSFVVLFIRNSCTPPLTDMCPVFSSLHRAERHTIWAKPTFLDAQICLHCCGNSSQTANLPLLTTHIDIYTKAQIAQKTSKKEQINLLQPAVCAFMCSTSFDCNPQKHETVCEPREARKKKPTQISCLRNIWEQKQSNFTHQSEATETGRDRKLL